MSRLMATDAASGRLVHIGNDREVTVISDLAKLVLGVVGHSPELDARPATAGSVARRCPDLSRLRALTGYEPRIPLEDGLRRTYAWYRDHSAAFATSPASAPPASLST